MNKPLNTNILDYIYVITPSGNVSAKVYAQSCPPIILNVYDNPKCIDKSWFGESHYYNSTGYYFTHPYSMMLASEIKYRFNNQIMTENEFNKQFNLVTFLPGTGGSVWIYSKI